MGRVIAVFAIVLFLVGCASQVKLRTETVEVFKPILYCPAPNWENADKPDPLAIDAIDDATSPGEVAKRYKATVKQLQDYSNRLELMLQKYDATNEAYDELKQQFMQQRDLDGFERAEQEMLEEMKQIERTLPEPTTEEDTEWVFDGNEPPSD